MPNVFPGGGQLVTADALLKSPSILARQLTALREYRFVTDQVLAKGAPPQGGAVLYQRSESIFPTGVPLEVMPRAGYPRTAWAEAINAAMVHKYGLEVPISDETVRRNALDVVARAQRKLANAVVKFVDGLCLTMLRTDASVLTTTASASWATAGTNRVGDIAAFRKLIFDQQEGYNPDTLIVNPAQELNLLTDTAILNALPRENPPGQKPSNSVITGRAVPVMGLDKILVTPTLVAGTVITVNAFVCGSVADEQPSPGESYSSYDPNANGPFNASGYEGQIVVPLAPVFVKVYREEDTDESIVRGARFPAMWLAEPKSVVVATGA